MRMSAFPSPPLLSLSCDFALVPNFEGGALVITPETQGGSDWTVGQLDDALGALFINDDPEPLGHFSHPPLISEVAANEIPHRCIFLRRVRSFNEVYLGRERPGRARAWACLIS